MRTQRRRKEPTDAFAVGDGTLKQRINQATKKATAKAVDKTVKTALAKSEAGEQPAPNPFAEAQLRLNEREKQAEERRRAIR